MLLRDLYKSRWSAKKESREAWLSACLTEVLDADRSLLTEVLKELTVKLGPTVTVEHQRRFGEIGGSQVADVLIENDEVRVILECKDNAVPDLGQLRGYQRHDPKAVVVLVAGSAAITKYMVGDDWKPFRRISWQQLYELAEPSTADSLTNWLRTSFRELLDWAGYAPVTEVGTAEVQALMQHWEQLAERQGELRTAVRALQPTTMKVREDAWQVTELSAWWSTARLVEGAEVRGLGLNAEPTPRGSFDWTLELRPSPGGPKGAVLAAAGFAELGFEKWWQVHLFRGRASGLWEEELATAVERGRAVLGQIGLRRGKAALKTGATMHVATLSDPGGKLRRTNTRVWAAARSLREQVAERVGGTSGRRYATVYDGEAASGWFWFDTEVPGCLRMWLGWGKPQNRRKFPLIQSWWDDAGGGYPGVALTQHPDFLSATFTVDLREVGLREACDRLENIADAMVRERRVALFSQ